MVAPAVEPVVGPVVEPAPDKLGMVGHRRGPVTVWRAARPEESTPVPRPRAASNGAGGGHVRLLAPRPPPEDEPLPRAGPT